MTPAEAIDTFEKTHLDMLVLGNYVLRRDTSS
jgi:predicted NodU family carbamoyl transferase